MWDWAMIARPPPLFARGKDLVAYPEGVRSAILTSSPTLFNQVSTIKKTSIWWSNIKLLISDHLTEVPIERALHSDILIELLENRDSERDDRIGTLIKLTLFVVLLTLRLVNFGKRDEITTWIGWMLPFFDNRLRFRFLDFRPIHKWLEAWIPRLFILAHREFEIGEIEMLKDCKSSRI